MCNLKISKRKCTETAIVLATVLLFFGWKYQDWYYPIATLIVLISSLLIPKLFYPLAKIWFALGAVLGFFSTKISLSIIFFLVLTPVGILRKLLGKDSLQLQSFKQDKSSVLKVREHQFSAKDLKNPF